MNLGLAIAAGLSALAVITDIRERRIPNVLIGIGLVLGVIVQLISGNLWNGFLAMLLVFVLFFPFYILGGFGAGDVKLLMVIGLLTSPQLIFTIIFWMAIAGGILSIFAILFTKKGRQSWNNLKYFFISLTQFRSIPKFDEKQSATLPYAIPIFLGVLIVWGQGLL